MAQFDNWPMFQNFSFQEFHFPVDRYEEWEAGRIVASGEVHFDIALSIILEDFLAEKQV